MLLYLAKPPHVIAALRIRDVHLFVHLFVCRQNAYTETQLSQKVNSLKLWSLKSPCSTFHRSSLVNKAVIGPIKFKMAESDISTNRNLAIANISRWCSSWWRIIDSWKSCKMGRVGSGQENLTHVQLRNRLAVMAEQWHLHYWLSLLLASHDRAIAAFIHGSWLFWR